MLFRSVNCEWEIINTEGQRPPKRLVAPGHHTRPACRANGKILQMFTARVSVSVCAREGAGGALDIFPSEVFGIGDAAP